MFDARVLERLRIDRRLLPPGSVVLFHEPSLWELYRGYVVAAVSALLVQGGLIGVLLVQRAQRRRAQRSLAERLRFETLLSDLSAVLSSCPLAEVDRHVEAGLRRIVEDLGVDRAGIWAMEDRSGEARLTHSWIREGVPAAPAVVQESEAPWIFAQVRQGHVVRLPRPGGSPDEALIDRQSLAWFGTRSSAVVPLIEGSSVVGSLSVGSALDERLLPDELIPRLRLLADIFANVLARRRAERAAHESANSIRDLAGRLMSAQEEERRRIARELHDGVNQDLAALSIALSALEDGLPEGTPADRREEVARLQGRTVELAEAIRQLSHELHPGILQYTGLAVALRSHCREFEREHGLTITFWSDDDLRTVPSDVALCLYRVTQEALKNAARHAKASQVRVTVAHDGGRPGAHHRRRWERVRPRGGAWPRRPGPDQPRRARPSRWGTPRDRHPAAARHGDPRRGAAAFAAIRNDAPGSVRVAPSRPCCSPTTTRSSWRDSRAFCEASSPSSEPWPTGPG